MRLLVDTSSQIRQEIPMTESTFRPLVLLALMLMYPVLLILSLAMAVAGRGQSTLPPSPSQVLASSSITVARSSPDVVAGKDAW
jgi:hypothetical protein